MHIINKHTTILLSTILLLLLLYTSPSYSTCYNPFSSVSSLTEWILPDSTPYYLAYACALRSDHVAVNTNPIISGSNSKRDNSKRDIIGDNNTTSTNTTTDNNLSGGSIVFMIDDNGGLCPGQCDGLPYACAEIASTQLSMHGIYECMMQPSAVPGTVTTCMVASATREPYEEIHVKFIGNDTTHVSIGFFTNGISYQSGPVLLPFSADLTPHSYSFEWTSSYINWYVDGTLVSSELGSRPIPTLPNRFIVNFLAEVDGILTDDSSIYTAPDVSRNFIMPASPAMSVFYNLSFTPVLSESCDNVTGVVPGPANWTAYDPNTCNNGPVYTVYYDSLAAKWSTTGSTASSLKATAYVHSGSYSISWDVVPDAQLYLQYSGSIDTNEYYGFELWVFGGGTGGQQLTTQLLFSDGTSSSSINLAELLISGIQQWTWSRVVLPFSSYGMAPGTPVSGLLIVSLSTGFEGTIYFDDIRLSQQYALCANRSLVVYDDKLENHFTDGSWGTYSLKSTSSVYEGSYAISWELYNNDGLQFQTNDAIDTNIYQGISMYVNYEQLEGWQINMAILIGGTPVGTMGLINYYGGSFPPGEWVRIAIPLYEFGINPGASVNGIQLVCNTNQYQGVLMIDNIEFISSIPISSSLRIGISFVCVVLQLALLFIIL